MTSTPPAPLATGYLAPIHGRGAMAFVLVGLFSFIVLAAGVLSPSMATALVGLGGLALAAAGFGQYWRVARTWPMANLYTDRLEFRRGPQRGTVRFEDVQQLHYLEWGRSLFPFERGARVLVLVTPEGEWQVGREIAEAARFQEAVAEAVSAFRRRAGRAPE